MNNNNKSNRESAWQIDVKLVCCCLLIAIIDESPVELFRLEISNCFMAKASSFFNNLNKDNNRNDNDNEDILILLLNTCR